MSSYFIMKIDKEDIYLTRLSVVKSLTHAPRNYGTTMDGKRLSILFHPENFGLPLQFSLE